MRPAWDDVRPWLARAGGLWTGAVVAFLAVALATGDLLSSLGPTLPTAAAYGALAAAASLLVWRGVVRNGRSGPAWGAVAAAAGTTAVAVGVTGVAFAVDGGSVGSPVHVAAFLLLVQAPTTVALAAVGAILETDGIRARVGAGSDRREASQEAG